MSDKLGSKQDALLAVYQALNGPAKAGRVWVTYRRECVNSAIYVLKQLMEKEGFEFRKEDQ